MFIVEVTNSQSGIDISDDVVIDTVRSVLQHQRVEQAEIVVALVDDETIHQVNREHLQHDYPTDVISFLYDATEPTGETLRGAGVSLDGELVISTETAVREAARYGWQPLDELRLYITHGLLHLCGYDDLCDEELRLMREQEREVLQYWNLVPHYD